MSGHGGNLHELARRCGRMPEEILDFSANLNPLGAPTWLRPVVNRALEETAAYPEPYADTFCRAAAEAFSLSAEQVVAGNGSTELLYLILRVLPVRRAWVPGPGYIDYARACRLAKLPVHVFPLLANSGFLPDLDALGKQLQPGDLVFLGQPNNPTGTALPPEKLRAWTSRHSQATFVIDEAFADFCPDVSLLPDIPTNTVVLRSLTKFYAMAGLRLGFAAASAQTAHLLREAMPPWSVNTLASTVGVRALLDHDYAARTRMETTALRERLRKALETISGLSVYNGRANYLLLKLNNMSLSVSDLAERLLKQYGIAIRVCDNYDGLDASYFRIAVRTESESGRLVEALSSVLRPALSPVPVSGRTRGKKARTLMLQGTGSSVGKSLLCAAFCRILLQDGYAVAPFKAQNMALNSFVTRDGGEMGRAQVVQAQACRLDPDTRMNPILLKPSSDVGSQVIVMGKPVGNMRVREYHAYKPTAFAAAKVAFDDLSSAYDIIILEGAGSPGEVNLKQHDIVNMRMAEYAESPVLLIGDIDRGGVYASLVGTMDVMDGWERALVKGFLINQFRGDASLLAPAHDYVEDYTGKPVVGVIPHLGHTGLPDEDSVSLKSGVKFVASFSRQEAVRIAMVKLPHVSNFSDFDALAAEPDVEILLARTPEDLRGADVVVLPGSKNVLEDFAWLDASGAGAAVLQAARQGHVEIVGLCGGMQILGRSVADPHGIESDRGRVGGLGLLPLATTLEKEKTLRQARVRHFPTGTMLSGYEIHHGRTVAEDGARLAFTLENGEAIGFASEDGRIWGTYLHGVFDTDAFRREWLDQVRVRKGMAPVGNIVAPYDLEPALEKLALTVREHVDLKRIKAWMGL